VKSVAFKIAVVVALGLVLAYVLFMSAGDVAGPEARRLVEGGARLVDVRTPEEFAAGHVPGAVNIPVQELDRRMGELESRDQPVVLYCASGVRSGRAARILKDAGYSTVHNLGPMSRW